jgi:hypothetical protein
MNLRLATLFLSALLPASSLCQSEPGTVPAGTPLAVVIDQHYPMRTGQLIRGHLLYPIYADNKLLLPKDTIVTGSVVKLLSDRKRRVNATLGGDFTPFHTPEVQFTHILLPDGATIPLACGPAATGAQIYRAIAPPPPKGGFFRQEFNSGLTVVRSDVATFTAPGKTDRLLQWVYGRLPYHPERIEKGTSWTVETAAALDVPAQPASPPSTPASVHKSHFWEEPQPAAEPAASDSGAWIVQANLAEVVSSETSRNGQAIKAVVAEPIFNPDHTIAVPQGAILVGAVTRAKPARSFARSGVLSFSFSQLILPNTETQSVETRLAAADSAQDIALSSEGQAKSKPQNKLAIPLFLAVLASRPLDQDCGHHGGCNGNSAGKNGLSGAAGLGLVGTIVSLAGGSPEVAAGIGYWGTARAVYSRWIARGQKITFAKDTRIVVQTIPRRAAPMTSNSPADPPAAR